MFAKKIMANAYSQLYIHLIFAVKNRESLLLKPWRDDVFKYMGGILLNKDHKPYIINGVEDHVHILFGLNPKESISDVVRDLKNNTSKYIQDSKFTKFAFRWSNGYGVFSCAKMEINRIYDYIKNQEEHHKKVKFETEFKTYLTDNDIPFDPQYLFAWIDYYVD